MSDPLDDLVARLATADDRVAPALVERDVAILLLAIAELSLRRPGWAWMLGELAERLGSRATFEQFRRTSADLITPEGDRTP